MKYNTTVIAKHYNLYNCFKLFVNLKNKNYSFNLKETIIILICFFISLKCKSQNPIPYKKNGKENKNYNYFVYVDSVNLKQLSNIEYNYAEPFEIKSKIARVQNYIGSNKYEVKLINTSFQNLFTVSYEFVNNLDNLLKKMYNTNGDCFYRYCIPAHYNSKNEYVQDKFGLIGPNGVKITEAKYKSINNLNEDVVIVENFANQFGFVDINGNEILKPSFSYISKLENGKAIVRTELGWSYVDKYGNELEKLTKHPVYEYFNNIYKLTDNNIFTIFKNKYGKTFLTLPFRTVGNFYNNEAIMYIGRDNKGSMKSGILNLKGKIIIPPVFNIESQSVRFGLDEIKQSLNEFKEGIAVVQTENGFGFINTKGQLIIQDKYSDVGEFSDGLAAVKDLYGWSFINTKGEVVISKLQLKLLNRISKPRFINFNNGFCKVVEGEFGIYYIDKSGRELIENSTSLNN